MNMTTSQLYIKGILLSIMGFTLFACGDAAIKYVSSYYNVLTVIVFNELFVLTFFLLLARPLGGFRSFFKSPRMKWHLIRGVFVVLQVMTIVYGFSHMSLAKVYALVFSAPLITSLLARIFLKEYISRENWLAIFVGFAGVLVILRPGIIPLDLPSLAVLVSALSFACYNLIAKHTGGEESLLALGFGPRVIFLFLVPFWLAQPEIPALEHMPYFALMGLLGATGFLAVTMAFIYAPASIAAPFHYIQMLWAILFGYLFFNDPLDPVTGVGAAIIIASGIWIISRKRDPDYTDSPQPPI